MVVQHGANGDSRLIGDTEMKALMISAVDTEQPLSYHNTRY